MELHILDIAVFTGFIGFVVIFSMYKSRTEETGEAYFLASRGLTWWLIGFSLIAANISTEQFVGMNGSAAGNVGMAIASYDWMAAITLVFVALFILPRFLKSGIYTIPEYLEYRYNATARGIMAFYTMVIYIAVTISAVLYSGGLTIHTIFGMNLTGAVWLIGIIAALYTTWGGLKAVAWADLFQGSALIIGGLCVTVFGLMAIGGPGALRESGDKMHMFLPADHPELPWTALVIGLWIPNFYYWGLNQYIAQRSLAARSIRDGQLGVLFAAGMQVILPLIIVIPGIIAHQLYRDQLATTTDAAFPLLIRNLVPTGLRGFILAAIAGAVISSLASMLNSASTIFTLDIYKRHLRKDASQKSIVTMGRAMTVLFVIIGCYIAPKLGDPRFKGIFHYIQDFQGYISPGILAAFAFGLFVKRAPGIAGVTALLLNVPVYGVLHLKRFESIAFLNKMAITFGVIVAVMTVITIIIPLRQPVVLPSKPDFDVESSRTVKMIGTGIILVTLCLYIIFW
ncbi:solute:sodium symporter family transporter [Candidatus Latescibacterota bacterium]